MLPCLLEAFPPGPAVPAEICWAGKNAGAAHRGVRAGRRAAHALTETWADGRVTAQSGEEPCLQGAGGGEGGKIRLFLPVVELRVRRDIDPPQQVQGNSFSYRTHVQLDVRGAIFGCSRTSLSFCPVGVPLLVSRLIYFFKLHIFSFVFHRHLLLKCIYMKKGHGRRSSASADHTHDSLQRSEARNEWTTEEDLLF